VPDLVRLLRSETVPITVRASAFLLLRQYTSYDLELEEETLENAGPELVETVIELSRSAIGASEKGTPFERLALADPEDDAGDLDEIVDELLESFLASPEAADVGDQEWLGFWAGELVRLGVAHGFDSPVLWDPADIEELLCDLLPRKITLKSAEDAAPAVPAFRAFFRWASRVAPVTHASAIDAELVDLEADFPSMMMDERRFGLAKSFVAKGHAAGFDMSTQEGLAAFQTHYNRQQIAGAAARKKLDAAKKRKAKMAKMSRRKNRRK